MNLRCKKRRTLGREERDFRDDRLFIIATEDTYAARQYFSLFEQYRNRIKVTVLETTEGCSAPMHVLDRLDKFREEYETHEDDELWLMLDTDHWTEASHVTNFTQVCTQAVQKGYGLAHSNPCFEMWLLLHKEDEEAVTSHLTNCEKVTMRLRDLIGGYNKRRLNLSHFTSGSLRAAVERAERVEQSDQERWPKEPGSHVHRIVRKLL